METIPIPNSDLGKINIAKERGDLNALEEIKNNAEINMDGETVRLAEEAILAIQNTTKPADQTVKIENETHSTEEGVKEEVEGVVPGENELSTHEKNKLSSLELYIRHAEKDLERLESNIEHVGQQREAYENLLNQEVQYISEEFTNGIAAISSPEAEKYTSLWQEFPANPFVASIDKDHFVDRLKEKGYSDQEIEKFKQKRESLRSLEKELREKYGDKIKNQSGRLGFSNSNTVKEPHHVFLEIGHGDHYFDGSLLNKKMPLGQLLDAEQKIKEDNLQKKKEELEGFIQERDAILNK